VTKKYVPSHSAYNGCDDQPRDLVIGPISLFDASRFSRRQRAYALVLRHGGRRQKKGGDYKSSCFHDQQNLSLIIVPLPVLQLASHITHYPKAIFLPAPPLQPTSSPLTISLLSASKLPRVDGRGLCCRRLHHQDDVADQVGGAFRAGRGLKHDYPNKPQCSPSHPLDWRNHVPPSALSTVAEWLQ